MKISLCNEVIADRDFAAQCAFAAEVGFDGLEIAPFTLDDEPHLLSDAKRREIRRAASEAGIVITGLHWLLITPKGLSVNGPDGALRARTRDVMERLVGLCADLGGKVLVHGSPQQRTVAEGNDADQARAWAVETYRAAGEAAEKAGVCYCIEPLARNETNFINTIEEAAAFAQEVDVSAFKTMIDIKAVGLAEEKSAPELIDQWLPTGMIGHIHFNDKNLRGPGQGETQFAPIMAAIARNGYDGVIAVEPFQYIPDGPTTAARSIGYLRGILETLP